MDVLRAVDTLVKEHQRKADEGPYDAKVSILAIGAARSMIDSIEYENDTKVYFQSIITSLKNLQESYNDTSGKYTSGKGDIGSLIRDIEELYLSYLESIGEYQRPLINDSNNCSSSFCVNKKPLSPRAKGYLIFFVVYGIFLLVMFAN